MIDGLSHLLTLRKQNLVPASVWLSIGVPYKKPKYTQDYKPFELVAHGSVAKDDFRPFVGLNVHFYTPVWNGLAAECYGKLKTVCNEITVLCGEYAEDIGFLWSKQYGQMDFGVVGWLEQFYNAKHTLCRTDKEVQERLRLENEALAKLHPTRPDDYK